MNKAFMSQKFANQIQKFFPYVYRAYRKEFALRKFHRNNVMIVVLSLFLFFEQLVYAFQVSAPGSNRQMVYVQSALAMLFFVFLSLFYQFRKPQALNYFHRFYEISLCLVGMIVALIRFMFIEYDSTVVHLPTIYIAVIYGSAVIFIFSLRQSFALYSLLSLSTIILLPRVHPEIVVSCYIWDIGSNSIIAFLVSALHYRNFTKEFISNKIIADKNKTLLAKNKEIERINQELQNQAERDELTGLFNRRKINQLLRDLHKRALRYEKDFAVILLDIDYFKTINDSFGHATGDRVLKSIANILHGSLREVDSCGRWGGEEFIVICPDIDCSGAQPLAERLRQAIGTCSFYESQQVTASFGIACQSNHSTLTQLLNAADMCLYEAKNKGRNRVITDSASRSLSFPFNNRTGWNIRAAAKTVPTDRH